MRRILKIFMEIARMINSAATTSPITVTDPISGAVIGTIQPSDVAAVKAAVARARAAQPAWEALGVKGRARLLRRWGDLIWADREALIATIRRETGKNRSMAYSEVIVTDNLLQYYNTRAHRILRPQWRRPLIPLVHTAKVHYKPWGVVGIISPWNFPYNLAFCDAIPALIAGNTVVLKPSEITPFSAEFGLEKMRSAGIPQDVFQIVHGNGSVGSALVDYVDFVHFTGSTAVGRKVALKAAERLIPCGLELGGKAPAIVLKDANLEMSASYLIRGAFENAGQYCMSVERVYAEAPIYEALVTQIGQMVRQMVVGAGAGLDVHMGSLTNRRELERAERLVADALSKGARLVAGGKARPDIGPLFYEPTVLADVHHEMDIMRQESFAPLMPIMRVESVEEAIQLANDTAYGLTSSVFTADKRRAEAIGRRLNAGDVNINIVQYTLATPDLPAGGWGESGIGRRNGPEGLLAYTYPQAHLYNRFIGQKPDLSHLTPELLRITLFLRALRRVFPFI